MQKRLEEDFIRTVGASLRCRAPDSTPRPRCFRLTLILWFGHWDKAQERVILLARPEAFVQPSSADYTLAGMPTCAPQ